MALLNWFLDLCRRDAGGTIETQPPPEPPLSTHRVTAAGLQFIRQWEGFRGRIYIDPAGYATVGFGHLVKPDEVYVHELTYEDALTLLRSDVYTVEQALREEVTVPLNAHRFDALASWTFNVGVGAMASSTLLRLVNAGHHDRAAAELDRWVWAGGQVLPGLVRRRAAERRLYEWGDYGTGA